MKSNHRLALGLFAAAIVGGAAVHGLHAQTKPPVYVVVELEQITDAKALAANTERSNANMPISKHGGRYIVRGAPTMALDGAAPKRVVIIAFDNMEAVKAWKDSADQKNVDAVRMKATKSRVYVVQGL